MTKLNYQETSREAWNASKARLNEREHTILAAIEDCGPMTNDELSDYTGILNLTVRPTVTGLKDDGKATDVRRPSNQGRSMIVWDLA